LPAFAALNADPQVMAHFPAPLSRSDSDALAARLRAGLAERGWGAWELAGRVSQLRLSERVFTGGFADPNVWSNSATTTEVGLNWYWNEHLKVYLFWLHGAFGDPVRYTANDPRNDVDMFWVRFQLFY
jgi:phosphate-selective porin